MADKQQLLDKIGQMCGSWEAQIGPYTNPNTPISKLADDIKALVSTGIDQLCQDALIANGQVIIVDNLSQLCQYMQLQTDQGLGKMSEASDGDVHFLEGPRTIDT